MNVPPDAETLARWSVLLNCWIWPDDLPGKPNPPGGLTDDQHKYAIRGAHTVLSLFADESLVDALWQDESTRQGLVAPYRQASS